jgi:F-type H+-transporting ATPase subunit epsilon
MTFHVDIVSLEKQFFSGRAEALFATGTLGEMGIYPGHAPLLSSLKPGLIRLMLKPGQEDVYYVDGGLLEVQASTVTVLADTAIRANDLDEVAVIKAKEQAEKALSSKQTDLDYTKAAAELAQALAQIRAIQNIRKKYKI